MYIHIPFYQNFRITTNQKSTIDTQIRKINSNATLKIVIKPQEERTREEGKKKEQQKRSQSDECKGSKSMQSKNCLECEWTERHNQKTQTG